MPLAEDRLAELGITLPEPPAAVANYVPFVTVGNVVTISGQLPLESGTLIAQGAVGGAVDMETARKAARLCAINVLAQLRAAAGSLNNVRRLVRLGGFVNCTADFRDQPEVINAASDLMVDIFGEAGRHARTAVGVNALPRGAPVEIDAVAEIARPG